MLRSITCALALLLLFGVAVTPLAIAEKAASTAETGLVWVSATEVRLANDTSVVDTAWQKLDNMPIMKTESRPAYPEGAKVKGLEADVWVQAIVGTDGAVHRAKIAKQSVHGLEPGFELCTLTAAMGNVFEPALKDGKPVAVWVTYPVSFRLK